MVYVFDDLRGHTWWNKRVKHAFREQTVIGEPEHGSQLTHVDR